MTDSRPLWLLDVDGVLNANKPGWKAAPRSATWFDMGRDFRVRWAPALVLRIRALHKSGAVEIKWASSWIGNTDWLSRHLGLPDFEAAYDSPGPAVYAGTDEHKRLKLYAALDVIEVGRPLIWTDDDAIPRSWLARDDLGDIGLFIAPKPNRGLQPEHMDAIEAFTRQHAPEGAPA